ncbi:MAG: glycoside hydrolase family 3 N-terminal domain-containing protein [Candidatus Faecousia sp.]|nr:glycoside hydrolase family 3 C-terminal domain-containing protein [Clostridiales bacterium]MDY6180859.1 glycoside hydrolase family 3 N-terminal domain-containing protein [Candidatus Faecousia sp.]
MEKEEILGALLAQEQAHHNPEKKITPGMPELLRSAAAQGAVLVENRVLPFPEGSRISVFGRCQVNWFCTGYGSGGDVNMPYQVGLLEGLRRCEELAVNEELAETYERWCADHPVGCEEWGAWPRFYPEMPLTRETVTRAAEVSGSAVVVIGRSSGEDRENALEEGSFYLTAGEREMLELVTETFPDTVLVLNIGAVMDLSFVKEYPLGAVLIAWQGGMESGNAVADILCGALNPSGRLTDTVALTYDDYPSSAHFGGLDRNEYYEDIYVGYRWFETFAPERVLYPFGYGLSYTSFSREVLPGGNPLEFRVRVTNTGARPGRDTVFLFAQKPCGALGNPARELQDFGKTKLLAPGEQQELTLRTDEYRLSSFDEGGYTGHRNCYVLQAGGYRLYVGGDVRAAGEVGIYTVTETRAIQTLTEAAAPEKPFPILTREGAGMAQGKTVNLKERILAALPEGKPITGDRGWKLRDVQEGRVSLEDFTAQLSLPELEAISRGAYVMGHPWGARGNAGIFGGVTESLRDKGVPPVVTTDGPSGIRLYDSCSLLPIGTLLACTFDLELVENLFAHVGREMVDRGSDVLLAPGMNIHRSPLCGRNFEYFSEDPYVSGKIAAAVVRGIQSQGVSACPKHFACNNQETRRQFNDSVVSQRALREIYLKGFEICVKEADPKNIMTSYNKINGVWGHYQYDLVQTILRQEWGYRGNVITDWWMQSAASPEFPELRDNAYRVRARVDVLMPGGRDFFDRSFQPDGTLLETYGKPGGITLGELQLCARHVLKCVMELKELAMDN